MVCSMAWEFSGWELEFGVRALEPGSFGCGRFELPFPLHLPAPNRKHDPLPYTLTPLGDLLLNCTDPNSIFYYKQALSPHLV